MPKLLTRYDRSICDKQATFFQFRVLESENDALQKEVMEKGELIEHWIRSRPQPSSGACSQKPESTLTVFYYFLAMDTVFVLF